MSRVTRNTRWFVIAGALIIQLILGTVYGYSIFWEPLQQEVFPEIVLEADVAQRTAEGADLSRVVVAADEVEAGKIAAKQQGYLKRSFAICILTFAIVMVIAGRVQDVKGPRFPAIVGAILLGTGFIIAGLMHTPIVFHLAHAAFMGALALVLMMIYHAVFGKVDHEQVPIARYIPYGILTAVIVVGVVTGDQYVGKLG